MSTPIPAYEVALRLGVQSLESAAIKAADGKWVGIVQVPAVAEAQTDALIGIGWLLVAALRRMEGPV